MRSNHRKPLVQIFTNTLSNNTSFLNRFKPFNGIYLQRSCYSDDYRAKQEYSNNHHRLHPFFTRPTRKTLAVTTGLLLVTSGFYFYWYYGTIKDFNNQICYVYLDHEGQLAKEAVMTALNTLNDREHKSWLWNNAFMNEMPSDIPMSDAQFDIVVANVRASEKGSQPSDIEGNKGKQFYTSALEVKYSLFPDVCQVTEASKGESAETNKVRIEKCKTVFNTRTCHLHFWFLVAPSIPEHLMNSDLNNAYRSVKVTMSALETDLNKEPEFFVTRVALCSVSKAFPHLPPIVKQSASKRAREAHYSRLQMNAQSDKSIAREKLMLGGEITLEKSVSIGGKVQSTNGLKKVEHVHYDFS